MATLPGIGPELNQLLEDMWKQVYDDPVPASLTAKLTKFFADEDTDVQGNAAYYVQELIAREEGVPELLDMMCDPNFPASGVDAIIGSLGNSFINQKLVCKAFLTEKGGKYPCLETFVRHLKANKFVEPILIGSQNLLYSGDIHTLELFVAAGGVVGLTSVLGNSEEPVILGSAAGALINMIALAKKGDKSDLIEKFATVDVYQSFGKALENPKMPTETIAHVLNIFGSFSRFPSQRKILRGSKTFIPILCNFLQSSKEVSILKASFVIINSLMQDDQKMTRDMVNAGFCESAAAAVSLKPPMCEALVALVTLSRNIGTNVEIQEKIISSGVFSKSISAIAPDKDPIIQEAAGVFVGNITTYADMHFELCTAQNVGHMFNALKNEKIIEKARVSIATGLYNFSCLHDSAKEQLICRGVATITQFLDLPFVADKIAKLIWNLTSSLPEAFCQDEKVMAALWNELEKSSPLAIKESIASAFIQLGNNDICRQYFYKTKSYKRVFEILPRVEQQIKNLLGLFLGSLANFGPIRLECQTGGHLAQLKAMEPLEGIRRACNNLSVAYEEEEPSKEEEDELAKWTKYFNVQAAQEDIKQSITEKEPEPEPEPEPQPEPEIDVPIPTVEETPVQIPETVADEPKAPEVQPQEPKIVVSEEPKPPKDETLKPPEQETPKKRRSSGKKPIEEKEPEAQKDLKLEVAKEDKDRKRRSSGLRKSTDRPKTPKADKKSSEDSALSPSKKGKRDSTTPRVSKKDKTKSDSGKSKKEKSSKQDKADKSSKVDKPKTPKKSKKDEVKAPEVAPRPDTPPKPAQEKTPETPKVAEPAKQEPPKPAVPEKAPEPKQTPTPPPKAEPPKVEPPKVEPPKVAPVAPPKVANPQPPPKVEQAPEDPEAQKMIEKAKKQVKRTMIMEEFLQTEESYVKNIDILIKKFKKPLENAAAMENPMITLDEVKSIFSCVEELFSIHDFFLNLLRPKAKSWNSTTKIGDVFLQVVDQFKNYSDYVTNFDQAVVTVRTVSSKQPRFKTFINQVSRLPICNHQGLDSFLIMPIQRVPRYSMLLEALIQNTWADHPDYSNLASGLAKVETVSRYLNEKKREHENLAKLTKELANISGDIREVCIPGRTLTKKALGTITFKEHLLKKTSAGIVYLFNDGVLLTKTKEKEEKFACFGLGKDTRAQKGSGETIDFQFPKAKASFTFTQMQDFTAFEKGFEAVLKA